jgi:hypothetical protein
MERFGFDQMFRINFGFKIGRVQTCQYGNLLKGIDNCLGASYKGLILDSGIDVGQGISIGQGKYGKNLRSFVMKKPENYFSDF